MVTFALTQYHIYLMNVGVVLRPIFNFFISTIFLSLILLSILQPHFTNCWFLITMLDMCVCLFVCVCMYNLLSSFSVVHMCIYLNVV